MSKQARLNLRRSIANYFGDEIDQRALAWRVWQMGWDSWACWLIALPAIPLIGLILLFWFVAILSVGLDGRLLITINVLHFLFFLYLGVYFLFLRPWALRGVYARMASRLLQNHGFAWDDGFVTSWHEDGWDV